MKLFEGVGSLFFRNYIILVLVEIEYDGLQHLLEVLNTLRWLYKTELLSLMFQLLGRLVELVAESLCGVRRNAIISYIIIVLRCIFSI